MDGTADAPPEETLDPDDWETMRTPVTASSTTPSTPWSRCAIAPSGSMHRPM